MKVLSYNTHLFGDTAASFVSYWKDKIKVHYHDDVRLNRIKDWVVDSQPDVVGLCEVWEDGFKKHLANELEDIYPYSHYNSDFTLAGNGLIILSKHEIEASDKLVFDKLGGPDGWAKKACLAARINYQGKRVRIFFTHTQACYKDNSYKTERFDNLNQIADLMRKDNTELPTILMGDFNVSRAEYWDMRQLFPGMKDSMG